jgi:hypothetical protein
MADLDVKLATIVKDQADWNTHIRLGFAILKDLLCGAYILSQLLSTIDLVGAKEFDIGVAVTGVEVAMVMLGALWYVSRGNEQEADGLTAQYRELATAATPSGTPLSPTKVAAAEQSTVSSFQAISASMAGMSALSEMPTVASLAGLAGGRGTNAHVVCR